MKLKKMSRSVWLVLAAFFLATIGSAQSYAAPRQGPDPAFSTNMMNYAVSRDGFTDITRNDFRIYTSRIDQGVTVRIYGHNLCSAQPGTSSYQKTHIMPASPVTTDETYNAINIGYDSTVTTYSLRTVEGSIGGTGSARVNGLRKSWSNCNNYQGNQRADIRISAADLRGYAKNTTIGNDGMYEFRLSVTTPSRRTGFVNGYRLEVLNDSRAIISQEAGDDTQRAQDFGIQIASPRNSTTYGNFRIPFGPDCTVPERGTRATIYLYDLDNPDSGIQPRTLRLRVSRYDTNQNRLRTESIAVSGVSSSNVSTDSTTRYTTIRAGNRTTVGVEFTVRPEYKYTLDMDRVFNNNTLQLSIPYSTVWFTNECNNIANTAQLLPSLTLQPAASVVPVGGQFRADFIAEETGGRFDANMQSGTARVWRENNGNDRFGAGDESLHSSTINSRTIRSGRTFRTQHTLTVNEVGSGRICASWNVVAGANTQLAGDGSITRCKYIGKSPLLGVLGGDIRAGAGGSNGAIIGNISTIGTSRYGSWAEYGMFAPGSIASFESGGVLSSSSLRSSGPLQSQLTFADQPTLGNFRSPMTSRSTPVTSTIQQASSRIPGTSSSATNYRIPRTGNHRTTFTGSRLTIDGNSDISGVVMIDAPDADVIINSNILYRNGTFSSIEQIPLVLINAKSIRLASGVTRLDAGLQTSGSISTCGNPATISDYYDGLRLSNCRNSLSLNGFVSAGSLYLRRTAGADGDSDSSRAATAERLNLRADTILRINSLTRTSNDSIRTTSITELPPRL